VGGIWYRHSRSLLRLRVLVLVGELEERRVGRDGDRQVRDGRGKRGWQREGDYSKVLYDVNGSV
jgi:hypothetical protein